MNPNVTLESLGMAAKGNWRLSELSLQLYPGEITAVCGPNGAGKSTLLGLLANDFQPTCGEIKLQERPLNSWSNRELARTRSRLEQQVTISFDFRVEEVVALGRFAWQEIPEETDKIVEAALQAAGADLLKGRLITQLSGGERQRVHLARVLAQVWAVPRALLLLDEPLSAQDLGQQQWIFRCLRRLVKEYQWSLVVVLHDLNLASLYADRVLLLEKGKTQAWGLPKKVLDVDHLSRVYAAELDIYAHSQKQQQVFMIDV
ncbi:iron complex transport system ATP-binding protein [Marinospirillum celere]|uniref:Iron complex transport system ATP-binding protein n=1 Tax=Marinospirillum celere TaxID=1122252 RepID=A0A1I1FRI2_9GAMM|nr:heme ABC transporter ATP-binding protein [Marinospirillum celere]SFC02057.1 iron complex transport system ATP-binding protein [Marinospirillum celere]